MSHQPNWQEHATAGAQAQTDAVRQHEQTYGTHQEALVQKNQSPNPQIPSPFTTTGGSTK